MAQGSFRVDPDQLRSASGKLRAESEALSQALERLRSALPAPSAMCGDDEQGQRFSADYAPKADRMHQTVRDMATALSRMADGLTTMADNYERADRPVGGR